MHRLKPIFSQSTLLSNNLVLTSYLSVILLRTMVFLRLWGGVQNTLKKKKKTDRRKTLKNEEKEKPRIRGKSIFVNSSKQ